MKQASRLPSALRPSRFAPTARKIPAPLFLPPMIVIRRLVDRRRAYTGIFLKGEPPKIFPTSDAEHARILQVYKQDRPHEGILNDFTDDFPPPDSPRPAPSATTPRRAKKLPAPAAPKKKVTRPAVPLWLAVVPPAPAPAHR